MTSYTDRLGLTIHAMGDELDAMRQNWNRLDQTFSGVQWVPPDTIPSNDSLYDGAMIAEIGTGKVWRAQANAAGTFDRHWVKYPWQIAAITSKNFSHSGVIDGLWGFDAVDPNQCVNSGQADIVATRVVAPVGGLYVGTAIMRWENGPVDGLRSYRFAINDSADTYNTESIYYPTAFNGLTTHSTKLLLNINAGDKLLGCVWQTSSQESLPTTHIMRLQLLRVNS